MILTAKQVTRFDKLLTSLYLYALQQVGDTETLRELERGDPSGRADAQMVDYIWGEDRIDGIIDRFIEDNPARLNRRDLRQVEDWKSGIYGDFVVVRRQNDVYFLTEDFGFVVRGIDDEIDHYLPRVPTVITTAILPFDGLVTFAIGVVELDWEKSPYLDESVALAHIDELQRSRRLARGERDFMRLSAECADLLWNLHHERLAKRYTGHDTALAERFDRWYDERKRRGKGFASKDELAPFFENLLDTADEYGLTEELLREYVANGFLEGILENIDHRPLLDQMLDHLDMQCEPGEPTYHLRDELADVDDKEIRPLYAQLFEGDEAAVDAMSHEELAEATARFIATHPDNIMHLILREGVRGVRDVRRVMEAGGSMLLKTESLSEDNLDDIIFPYPPFLYVYHEGDDYRYVMCDEVCEALGNVNWDHLEEDARALESAAADIAETLEYRGVAPANDLAEEALGLRDFHEDAWTITLALRGRLSMRLAPCAVCYIDEVPHLISPELLDACGDVVKGGGGKLSDPELALTILERRKRIRPRPIVKLEEEPSYLDQLFALPSWNKLEGSLTRYASTGSMTSRTLIDVVYLFTVDCQFDEHATDVFWDVLDETGVKLPMRYRSLITPDIEAFADDIPRWDLNGWSHSDLRECLRVR